MRPFPVLRYLATAFAACSFAAGARACDDASIGAALTALAAKGYYVLPVAQAENSPIDGVYNRPALCTLKAALDQEEQTGALLVPPIQGDRPGSIEYFRHLAEAKDRVLKENLKNLYGEFDEFSLGTLGDVMLPTKQGQRFSFAVLQVKGEPTCIPVLPRLGPPYSDVLRAECRKETRGSRFESTHPDEPSCFGEKGCAAANFLNDQGCRECCTHCYTGETYEEGFTACSSRCAVFDPQ